MARITMSSSRGGDTLSQRLCTLHSYHSNEKEIWDIGCDHGLLGLSFKSFPNIERIHLVDPSLPVIKALQLKLVDSYITKPEVFIHHKEGQQIEINGDSNCIFIAGMGGKEIGTIIQALLPGLNSHSRFVISPHRKILELRQDLSELPITLEKEEVILEGNQFYQILSLIPGNHGSRVSLYGESIWKGGIGELYREHQLKYFSLHRDKASLNYISWLRGLTPEKSY